MPEWPSTKTPRRAFLAAATASLTAIAGCSALDEKTETPSHRTVVDRIVVRADTDRREPIRLTLVHAARDAGAERPVWTTVHAPADGQPKTALQGLELGPGFFSMTAVAERTGSHEVDAFNTYGDEVRSGPYQYEVVIKQAGDLWLNLNDVGASISIPGYDA